MIITCVYVETSGIDETRSSTYFSAANLSRLKFFNGFSAQGEDKFRLTSKRNEKRKKIAEKKSIDGRGWKLNKILFEARDERKKKPNYFWEHRIRGFFTLPPSICRLYGFLLSTRGSRNEFVAKEKRKTHRKSMIRPAAILCRVDSVCKYCLISHSLSVRARSPSKISRQLCCQFFFFTRHLSFNLDYAGACCASELPLH